MTCQHSRYTFALLEDMRLCQCVACLQQWTIHLGSGTKPGENATDYIRNDMSGLEFIELRTKLGAARMASVRARE